MQIEHTLNLGILAHVDAGKTSLTERLLFDTGVIDALGSVDAGTTQTDHGTIERQRGITVRSAVVSFVYGGTQVNVLDTPGHTDFVAEVGRALGVLDAAVLVVSAVEGVQAHTRGLARILRELRLPTLFFVNKVDRAGARFESLLVEIRRTLTPHVLAMSTVSGLGTREARVVAETFDDKEFRLRTAEALAEVDDGILGRVVDGPDLTAAELNAALRQQITSAKQYPVLFGSALTGEGIPALLDAITGLFPSPPAILEADQAAQGTVFAMERAPSGAKTAYLRMFSGTVAARQQVTMQRREYDGTLRRYTARISSLHLVGGTGDGRTLTAGDIGRIIGLAEVRVGDRLAGTSDSGEVFAPPTLRSVVRSRNDSALGLLAALRLLAEQDPLLHPCVEPDGTLSILLYGEIQKQIIATTLADEFGIEVEFDVSEPVCIEQVTGTGEAGELMGHRGAGPSGFWATVALRVEPAPAGSGVTFRYETHYGSLPRAFHQAIEDTVYATLRRGPRGRAITDCTVTLTRTGFAGPITTAADFRGLTPIVLSRAVQSAGTRILEPHDAFDAEIPTAAFALVMSLLATLAADIEHTALGSRNWLIRGTLPTRHARTVQERLPDLTAGEGTWWTRPAGYRPLHQSNGVGSTTSGAGSTTTSAGSTTSGAATAESRMIT
ncbi:GTP-binding protein [Nocardia sp. NPDC049149]|uniref:GTP-binding protein n=1 Tax=Nocardia sp. NPDC049149 TaxID=3364315 RepID=UPI00371120DA